MRVWVIGSGGMLGSALVRDAPRAGAEIVTSPSIPWEDAASAVACLRHEAARFIDAAGVENWAVVWAAGASVVASDEKQTSAELTMVDAVTATLADRPPPGPGAFFLTSSAGGLYAGAQNPPFSIASDIQPISPYGRLKKAQEEVACARLEGIVPVILGRFSNLYGPGHRTGKAQGLIPLLCRAALQRRPLNLYVSMDTVRDYLYVDDAATMTWQLIQTVHGTSAVSRTEILASGQPATVAEVIATIQNVAHRRVPLALGTHASAPHQATDLRLIPTVRLSDLTPLPSGIKRVFDSIVGKAA